MPWNHYRCQVPSSNIGLSEDLVYIGIHKKNVYGRTKIFFFWLLCVEQYILYYLGKPGVWVSIDLWRDVLPNVGGVFYQMLKGCFTKCWRGVLPNVGGVSYQMLERCFSKCWRGVLPNVRGVFYQMWPSGRTQQVPVGTNKYGQTHEIFTDAAFDHTFELDQLQMRSMVEWKEREKT